MQTKQRLTSLLFSGQSTVLPRARLWRDVTSLYFGGGGGSGIVNHES